MKLHRTPALATLIATVLMAPAISSSAFAQADQTPAPETKKESGHTRGVSVLVTALDTNKDGILSAEEIANAPKALLLLDRNQDGRISGEEFHPTMRPLQSPTSEILGRLMEFDKDGDGKLTKAEVPERMESLFTQVDTNSDGILDKAELTAFVERTEKQQAQRRTEQAPRVRNDADKKPGGERAGVQVSGKDTFVNLGGNTGLTRRLSRILVALDTNKDMQLSAEEIANAATSLKALDINGDGQIDAEELSAAGKTEFVSPEVKAALRNEAKPTSAPQP